MSEENKALGRREIGEIFNGSNLDAADEGYASDFVDHDRAFSWEMHGPELPVIADDRSDQPWDEKLDSVELKSYYQVFCFPDRGI